jgi:ABC-type antimicrobial peptide transport system permease subunit
LSSLNSSDSLLAVLVAGFAMIGVMLAVGLYGRIAHVLTQRTHEIGIRLALGATRRKISHPSLFARPALIITNP